MKERVYINRSWIEPTRGVVQNPAERCQVWEYIFAEQMRILFDYENTMQPPTGAGAAALAFLLPQVQTMCDAYKAAADAKAAALERANAKRKQPGTRTPAGGANYMQTICDADANDMQPLRSTPLNNNNNNNNNIDDISPLPPEGARVEDDDTEIFNFGLDFLREGKLIDADFFRDVYRKAKEGRAAGTIRTPLKNYLSACLKYKIPQRADGLILANIFGAFGVPDVDVLECEGVEIENGVCRFICSEKARQAIERAGEDADAAKRLFIYLNGINARQIEYKTRQLPNQAQREPQRRLDLNEIARSFDLGFEQGKRNAASRV